MKIEFLKGASKGENEHNHCHSPLVAEEMENVRFFKYWYFKEHFSSQGNKVSKTGLGKSRMANSILSSWGNSISTEVWVEAELHPQIPSSKIDWILIIDGNIAFVHLI